MCEACGEGGVTATEVAQLIDALLHLNTYCNPNPSTLTPKPYYSVKEHCVVLGFFGFKARCTQTRAARRGNKATRLFTPK